MSEGPRLKFQPADKITINLTSNETAKTAINVENVGNVPVAFKVKTTQPKRYLVKPNQGVLEPGASDRIYIQVVPKERQALVSKPSSGSQDRFLVQYVACDDRLVRLSRDSQELTDELTTLWSGADKKEGTLSTKFTVSFTGTAGSTEEASGTMSADRLKELLSTGKGGSSPGTTPTGNISSTEVLSMRKKYDDLVSYTVNLTAERDKLKHDLEQAKKEYQKALAARITAENAQGGGKEGSRGGASKNARDSEGFSLIQVLLVALVCFLLGRYLHV